MANFVNATATKIPYSASILGQWNVANVENYLVWKLHVVASVGSNDVGRISVSLLAPESAKLGSVVLTMLANKMR